MTNKIIVPGQGVGSTKDMILSLLAREHPLTAKQITNKIRKVFGTSATFQGVYKALASLEEDKVITKQNRAYSLSKNWIISSKGFFDKLHREYFSEKPASKTDILSKDVQVYAMRNLIELDKFWIKVFETWFEESSGKVLAQVCGHAWYILGQLENETACLQNIRNHKLQFYTLIDDTTPLDRWAARYYEGFGFKYKMRKAQNSLRNHYYIVYGDRIMECVYPEKLAKDIQKVYDSVRNIKDLDLKKFIQILTREEDLKITVMRNKPLAEQLRKGIMAHWQ